jgi:hypothetical protein
VWIALDGMAALPLIIAVGWASLRTPALPRWFGHSSWFFGSLALLMSLGAITDEPAWLAGGGPATLAGFVAGFVWLALLGVIFLRLDPAGVSSRPS